jgi:hypothetical protein
MARIVQANRRATNRQIMAQYNSGVQNDISECTTHHRWAYAADDNTRFHSYQLKTRRGSRGNTITNIVQLRSEKTLPGPTNPGFLRHYAESQDLA